MYTFALKNMFKIHHCLLQALLECYVKTMERLFQAFHTDFTIQKSQNQLQKSSAEQQIYVELGQNKLVFRKHF